jgi:hypothetical protein
MERATNHQVSHGGELRGTYKTPRILQDNIFDVGNKGTAGNNPFPYGTPEITSFLPAVETAAALRIPMADAAAVNPFLGVGNEDTAGNTPFPFGTPEIGDLPAVDADALLRLPMAAAAAAAAVNPFLGVGYEGLGGYTP